MSARSAIRRTRLRLPIRLKLAAVSAALTFAILLTFALVVGAFTQQKLQRSFDDDLRATAADIQDRLRVQAGPRGGEQLAVPPSLLRVAAAGGAAIRVIGMNNQVLGQTPGAPSLGPPVEGTSDLREYRVVARPLFGESLARGGAFDPRANAIVGTVAFVQYAKPKRNLENTIARVRFFLAVGVLGGTALAFLAGLAVARRAMRPIAGLTRAAREIAVTRDPAQPLPKPAAHDEVAELADTLEEMLSALGDARAESEAALERQRAFVADASHELRTPLTSILANLELLEAELGRDGGARDPEGAAETAASALRSSRRMRRLVGDLLLLARADAGREEPHRPVDLAEVVREAAAEASALAGDRPLAVDVPAGTATVAGARDDLHRMALNLIENALIHTPAGTPVTVAVRAGGERVTLEVADRGPGVAPELRSRIFERFARESPGAAGRPGGSGLGLSIVLAVARAHGGNVEVGDAPGGGALFAVDLPAGAQTSTTTGSTIGRRLSRR